MIAPLRGGRTEDVIREILEGMVETGASVTREECEDTLVALLKRESIGSTGLGGGVSLPHVKLASVHDFAVGLGVSRSGVDFRSSDGSPVHVVFLVISPRDDPYGHLRLMGLIAGLVRRQGFLDGLCRSRTPDSALDWVAKAEWALFPDE